MILVLAGTSEGRELTSTLLQEGYQLLVTAVTEYGALLLAEGGNGVLKKALTAGELKELIEVKGISVVIDATHPYAKSISHTAIEVCKEKQIPFLRFERTVSNLPNNPLIHKVHTYEEAVKAAATLGEVVLLTTGTRNLEQFSKSSQLKNSRVIARVLPEPEGLQRCRELGFLPRDIIAMQGPFSEELNSALYRQYEVQVVVTKESGPRGGTDTKVAAALKLGIPTVIIERPELDYPNIARDLSEVNKFLKGVI